MSHGYMIHPSIKYIYIYNVWRICSPNNGFCKGELQNDKDLTKIISGLFKRDIRPLESVVDLDASPQEVVASARRASFCPRDVCGEVKWEKSGIIQQDPRLWEYQSMTLGQFIYFICKHTFKPCLETPDSMSSMSKLGSCGPDPRVNVVDYWGELSTKTLENLGPILSFSGPNVLEKWWDD